MLVFFSLTKNTCPNFPDPRSFSFSKSLKVNFLLGYIKRADFCFFQPYMKSRLILIDDPLFQSSMQLSGSLLSILFYASFLEVFFLNNDTSYPEAFNFLT